MRIAFVDFSGWDYTPDTPYERPLGGSHSAMCYLAEELAREGHRVWIVNGVETPRTVRGVSVVRFDVPGLSEIAQADAVAVLNGCPYDKAAGLRRALGDGPMFIYWTQHADDQPASKNLADPAMRALWDQFVLISDWQAERYRAVYDLPADKVTVLRNAVGPSFRRMFADGRPVFADRPQPPVLAYASTPFRGLSVLLDAFPRIRAAVPGVRLKVFSSMAVYQVSGERDAYADLYRRCRETEGIEYVGSLPQPELARELAQATCLAYPNTFAETSCIAVMEASAAGCLVVTSSLGALPETLGGYGFAMAPPADPAAHAVAFADLVVRVLGLVRDDPERAERYLADQTERFDSLVTWPVRARQWARRLAELTAARRAARAGRPVGGPRLVEILPDRTPLGPGVTLTRGRHGVCARPDADPRGGEPDEAAVALLGSLLRPDDALVEAGAGIGALTAALAERVGSGGAVVAVEDDPDAFALLCANMALNGLPQVRPSPGLSSEGWRDLAERLPACRLLTVEADGREAEVLAAAAPLLERHRPLIYCRIRSRATFDALAAVAARLDRRLFWHGRRDGETGAFKVSALALPARTLMGIDATPARDFDEAAALFPGFA